MGVLELRRLKTNFNISLLQGKHVLLNIIVCSGTPCLHLTRCGRAEFALLDNNAWKFSYSFLKICKLIYPCPSQKHLPTFRTFFPRMKKNLRVDHFFGNTRNYFKQECIKTSFLLEISKQWMFQPFVLGLQPFGSFEGSVIVFKVFVTSCSAVAALIGTSLGCQFMGHARRRPWSWL